MNVAIFGGTFDPVHRGHLVVARAAARRYRLGRIYFVPADLPPHKSRQPIAPFSHRYARVALATAGEKRFVPSLIEKRDAGRAGAPNYSIETVRRFRQQLGRKDRLFFLIGVDAFLEIATWRQPEALLREAEFIVAGRPGFPLEKVEAALPESLRAERNGVRPARRKKAPRELKLGAVTIHLLAETHERVSATEVRAAAAKKKSLKKMVPPAVAEYIEKMRLYQGGDQAEDTAVNAPTHHHHHAPGGE